MFLGVGRPPRLMRLNVHGGQVAAFQSFFPQQFAPLCIKFVMHVALFPLLC